MAVNLASVKGAGASRRPALVGEVVDSVAMIVTWQKILKAVVSERVCQAFMALDRLHTSFVALMPSSSRLWPGL